MNKETLVVATAGHIDHGKSSLVLALTGDDPDRLAEEKRRGITIALGFAHLDLADKRIAFIDVPGHEKFVSTMIGGAQGVAAGILVVAADEGVMPQTREHFRILQVLGIPPGILVLSKSDLVEQDMLDMATEDLAGLVKGTDWENAPVVACSAKSGVGLNELKDKLINLSSAAPKNIELQRLFALPMDRSFSMKGHGTVITGTVQSGSLKMEQTVSVFPGEKTTRVRAMQAQGEDRQEVCQGQRAALNLGDLSRDEVGPGRWLLGSDLPFTGSRLLAVRAVQGKEWPQQVVVHVGTAKVPARCSVMDENQSLILLRLKTPVIAFPGQRIVLRRPSPVETLGGGVVLANRRPRFLSKKKWLGILSLQGGDPSQWDRSQHLKLLLAEQPGGLVSPEDWRERTGLNDVGLSQEVKTWAMLLPQGYVNRGDWHQAQEHVLKILQQYHEKHPDLPGLPRAETLKAVPHRVLAQAVLGHLLDKEKVKAQGDYIFHQDFKPLSGDAVLAARQTLLEKLKLAGLSPPPLQELWQGPEAAFAPVLAALRHEKNLEQVGQRFIHQEVWTAFCDSVREKGQGVHLDMSHFKDLTGLSRKFLIPLLEHLDAERITKREGTVRVVLPAAR